MAAVSNTDEVVITRADGAGFTISPGVNHTADSIDNASGAVSINTTAIDVSGAPADLFDRNFDGFVSQIATFGEPLLVSDLSGYVNSPSTIPETLVNSDGYKAMPNGPKESTNGSYKAMPNGPNESYKAMPNGPNESYKAMPKSIANLNETNK